MKEVKGEKICQVRFAIVAIASYCNYCVSFLTDYKTQFPHLLILRMTHIGRKNKNCNFLFLYLKRQINL